MTQTTESIIPFELDLERVRRVLDEEIHMFKANRGKRPLSQAQELRGQALTWLAVFLPEVYDRERRIRLEETVLRLKAEVRYLRDHWFELLPLEAALFALTRERSWLVTALRGWDYGGSQVRRYVHQCLALVAPRMDLTTPGLAEKAARCLEVVYFFTEEMLAVLAVMASDPGRQQVLFRAWLKTYGHRLNRPEKEALDNLCRGEPMANPHLSWLMRLTSYICLRLACGQPLAGSGIRAPRAGGHLKLVRRTDARCRDVPAEHPGLFCDATGENPGQRVWRRLSDHPLMGLYVEPRYARQQAVG